MVYKVDGGVSGIRREEPVIKKPEVKPAVVRNDNPQTNAAVYTNRSDTDNQAGVLRVRLNSQFAAAPARQVTPTISPAEAQQRADDIIKANGGKDNLNTEGVGRDLAAIAKTNPADAWAITHAMLGDSIDQDDKGKVKEKDKDEIAQSFTNNLNDSELDTVAKDESGRAMLERMQRHLLSGSVHGDEYQTADRLQKAIGKHQTFSEHNQGIDRLSDLAMTTPYGAAFDPKSSPEEAAAALKSPYKPYDPQSDVQAFTDQLEAHKNDPAWLRSYYAALGSDKTAELINTAASSSGYSSFNYGGYGSPEAAEMYNKNMDIIGDSLETLRRSGGLSQTDMNHLVNSLNDNLNPSVALDMFGKASPEVREMFVRSAIANGDDKLEAAGSYILSQMSTDTQSRLLGGLSDEQLGNFIQGAMAGQSEAIDMSNYLSTGIADKRTMLGGVEKLLETANRPAGYYGSTFQPAPFSNELKMRLFDAVTKGLTDDDAFNNLDGSTKFKDELSTLAVSQHDEFIKNALNADGGASGEDLSPEVREQYSKLLQMTLFTPPLGDKSGDLMKHIDSTYKGIGNDLKNLNDQEFEAKYGRNRAAMARAFGEMTGELFKALDEGLTKVKDDAEKAAEIMDPIFKLVDFGTGKALDKAGPIGKVISTALDLTGASDAAKEAIQQKIKDGKIKEAFEDMKKHGVDISKLGEQLYEEVHNNLLPNTTDPNGTYRNADGTSISIKDAWQNGYDHVEGAPKS
jgi:hypothetical protein